MEGYLDHLETTSSVGRQKKIWVRRFFKLNLIFHMLEVFTDETQRERRGKLELQGAVVATADELGGLLSDDKDTVELSRRFIFRIAENGNKKHHYLCADLSGVKAPASMSYKSTSSTRGYLEKWLQALRSTIAAGEDTPLSAATMGLGELNAHIGAFMNHLHLSARISNRVREHGKSIYEITVKAWILERELAMVDEDQDTYHGHTSVGSGEMTWQILEYSCAWKLQKSSAELRTFDEHLRLLFSSKMHHIAFPSSSIGTKLQQLHASGSLKETENQQRMQVYDTYLQSLLRLPAFSSFGSDASTMLDTFLDISPHLAPFRKLEKEIGQSMHLRDRKVVPWKDRERFEMMYKVHLQVIATQQENARLAQRNHVASQKNSRTRHHRRHRHHHFHEKSIDRDNTEAEEVDQVPVEAYVAPLPTPVKFNAEAEETRPGESVQERMARIGHRLVVEAFEA